MPELPEVETVRAGLSQLIIGKQIAEVDFDWPKSFPNAQTDVKNFLIGADIVNVTRRAKVLLIELSSKYSLVIHLKMTGQLVYIATRNLQLETGDEFRIPNSELRFGAGHPSNSLVGPLPDKSTRVTLVFGDGSKLFFNDQRKFGWIRLMPTVEIVNLDFFKKVGPEPLGDDFSWQVMKERLLRRRNTNIKAALLDQSVIAGIGNIYADESLWGAKIHPMTMVRDVPDKKIKALHKSLQEILRLSIEKGGSSSHTYVNAEGKRGSYMNFASVFRREGQACPRCGTTIIKLRVAGRGTHICPYCQKPQA
jgi:formamidopyrimidine-DNA glycosylase